jgi:hypothetical protein
MKEQGDPGEMHREIDRELKNIQENSGELQEISDGRYSEIRKKERE